MNEQARKGGGNPSKDVAHARTGPRGLGGGGAGLKPGRGQGGERAAAQVEGVEGR